MKAIVCEMCNGTDFVKEDSFFVCQHCGIKYSLEETKKMMFEGTVKIDDSDELKNLYEVARRAKHDGNSELAKKYYDMILIKDTKSWEAAFYAVYYQAMSCKIGQIGKAASDVMLCETTVLQLINDNVIGPLDRENAITEIGSKLISIAFMLFNAAKKHYNEIGDSIRAKYTQEFIDRALITRSILGHYGDSLEKMFGADYSEVAVNVWKKEIEMYEATIPYLANKDNHKAFVYEIKKKIGKYNKTYIVEELEKEIKALEIQADPRSNMTCLLVYFMFCALPLGIGFALLSLGAVWSIGLGVGLIVIGAIITFIMIYLSIDQHKEAKKAIEILPYKKAELEKLKK